MPEESVKLKIPISPKQIAFFALSIVILIYVFRYVGLENMFETIKKLKLLYLIPIIACSFADILLDTLRHQWVIRELEDVPYRKILPIFMVGMFFNALTPGAKNGGEFVKAYYLSKEAKKIDYYKGLAIFFIIGFYFILAFWPCAILAILATLLFMDVGPTLAGSLFLLMLLAGGIAAIFIALHKNRHAIAQNKIVDIGLKLNYWLLKYRTFETYSLYKSSAMISFAKFTNTWAKYTSKTKLMWKCMVNSWFGLLTEFVKTYIIFIAIGHPVSFFTVMAVVAVSRFAGYLLILPGGVGVTEATMIAMFSLFGIAPGVAAAVTLIDRATYYLFNTYGLGLVAWGWLAFKHDLKPVMKKVVEQVRSS